MLVAGKALISPNRCFPTVQRVPDLTVVKLCRSVSRLCVTPLAASTPMCAFMPKYQSLPFLVDHISGSRAPALFLVEGGASMIVVSTSVPERSVMPLFEDVGASLQEEHAEDVFLELRCIHFSAKDVCGGKEVPLKLGVPGVLCRVYAAKFLFSNIVLVFHIVRRVTASLRASATRAFQLPDLALRRKPHCFKAIVGDARYKITVAASNRSLRVNLSPAFEIRPPMSTSPDWYRCGVSPR